MESASGVRLALADQVERRATLVRLGGLLHGSASDFPVTEWQVDDLHVWPVILTTLFESLIAEGTRPLPAPARAASWVKERIRRAAARAPGISRWSRSAPARTGAEGEVVMIGERAGAHRLGEVVVQNHLTPLRIAASEAGISSALLLPFVARDDEVATRALLPGTLGLLEHFERARRSRTTPLGSNLGHLLPGYREWRAALGRTLDLSTILPDEMVCHRIAAILAWADLAENVLRTLGCRFVFLYNPTSHYNMAVSHAARRLGLRVADVQHGLQHDLNYGFMRIPEGGFTSLPSTYLCWTAEAADRLETLSGGAYDAHLVGYSWILMEQAVAEGRPEDPRARARVEELARIYEGYTEQIDARRGLATRNLLYSAYPREDPGFLASVVRRLPPGWRVWLRLHPRDVSGGTGDAVATAAATLGSAVEVELASRAPLPLLLRAIDVHATQFSSVCTEAATLGVPTVMLDDFGERLFADEIRDVPLLQARGPEQAAQRIEEAARWPRPSRPGEGGPGYRNLVRLVTALVRG